MLVKVTEKVRESRRESSRKLERKLDDPSQSYRNYFKKLITFTQNYLDPLFRTVSQGSSRGSPGPPGSVLRRFRFVRFPGFPGPPWGSLGPPGVRSRKVQRVIPSIQSVLPSRGDGESVRKSERVRECW